LTLFGMIMLTDQDPYIFTTETCNHAVRSSKFFFLDAFVRVYIYILVSKKNKVNGNKIKIVHLIFNDI